MAKLLSKPILLFTLLIFISCSRSREVSNDSGSYQKPSTNMQTQEQQNLNSSLEDLTNQIVNSLSEEKKSRLAVMELVDLQGKTTDFGRFVAEELITRLYKTKKFYVIERQLLNKVLEEHKLTATGLIDETSAKELGKILGVDAIASGTVTDLTNSVKVNSRLFSSETGSIFAVASCEINKTADVQKLLGVTSYVGNNNGAVKENVTAKSYQVGLRGEYFNLPPDIPNSLPDSPNLTRIDKNVDFEWSDRSPASGIASDYFGVRWTGEVYIPTTGTYKFNMGTDDGNRLWVNDKMIINRWKKGAHDDYGEIYLSGGQWFPVKIEFFEIGGRAAAFFRWIPIGESKYQAVSSKYLRAE